MANTTSKPEKTRKPAATPRGTCRLTLTINGTRYALKPVPCDRQAARQCFELRKSDGTVYHVSRHDHGAECTCADFAFNRDGIDPMGCKHVRSLVALGILDTRPARIATPPPSAWNDDLEAAAERWPAWTDETRYEMTR